MTSTIVSIIIFLVLVVFFVVGWKKGFLKIILSTVSLFATLVIAVFLLNPTTQFLSEHTKIQTDLEKRIEKSLGFQKDEAKENGIDYSQQLEILENMEESEQKKGIEEQIINELSLPGILKKSLIEKNTASEYIKMKVESFKQYIVRSIATIELKILTYIGLVIAIFILIRILLLVSKVITNIPVIKGANKFFGGITGLIEGLFFIWIAGLIVSLIAQTEAGIKIVEVIDQSFFLKFLYEQNLLLKLLGGIFTI